jgi:hypothetical protein
LEVFDVKNVKRSLLLVLSAIMLTVLCACDVGNTSSVTKKGKTIPEVDPAALITAEDVASYAGYTPVKDEDSTQKSEDGAVVLYRSEPIGEKDTVKVKVIQYSASVTKDEIKERYENAKNKRSSAEEVSGIGEEAYIAFPTIHVYDRGCIIEITAGSGSDDTQKVLLKNLAAVAVQRLEETVKQ